MTAASIVATLLACNIVGGFAILSVLALRGGLRRLAGAKLAYRSWLIVPVAIAAGFIPARVETVRIGLPAAGAEPGVFRPAGSLAAALPSVAPPVAMEAPNTVATAPDVIGIDWTAALAIAWAVGALIALTVLTVRQLVAVRGLGPLTRISATTSRTMRAAAGPAVVGVFAPRIVLPANFEESFDGAEQKVVLAHEEEHLRGRHTTVKTVVEIAVCLAWFNPLAYLAARAIALDQELACDEAVAVRFPADRKVYAGALLKARDGQDIPLGCYWPAGSAKNLKTRIRRLGVKSPGPSRHIAGTSALVLLAAAAGGVAWGAKPAQTRLVDTPPQEASGPQAPPQAPDRLAQAGSGLKAPIYLRGKVEKIDFEAASYIAYVRASSIAADETAPAQANSALWELAPTPYWGDRTAVSRDLLNTRVAVQGSNPDGACASICRLADSIVIVHKPSSLPAATSGFGMADFAMRYDTGKSYLVRGTVERIEFGERTFDAYVRMGARGPVVGGVFQVRSENRFPRAEVEAQLLKQVVTIAGWRTKGAATGADHEMWEGGPLEAACDNVCGLYGTDFVLPNGKQLTPTGARLVSEPARYDPDALPVVPAGYTEVAAVADRNAPLTLTGRIVRWDASHPRTGFFVEGRRVDPGSASGAELVALWRTVILDMPLDPDWIGATVTLHGYAAKDKSCRPACVIGVTNWSVSSGG